MNKKALGLILIIVLLLCFGCTKKEDSKITTTTMTKVTEPVIKDDKKITLYNLRFYLPEDFKANSYNGVNNTFNYYVNNNSNNCELIINLKDPADYSKSIKTFIEKNYNISMDNVKKENINGSQWYTGTKTLETGDVHTIFAFMDKAYIYGVKFMMIKNGTICTKGLEDVKKSLYYHS